MTVFAILLVLMALCDVVKMSMASVKNVLVWCFLWGLVAFGLAIWVSRMSAQTVYDGVYSTMAILCVAESIAFICYCFGIGRIGRLLQHYSGVMIFMPLLVLASEVVRLFPGIDFVLIAISFGLCVALLLAVMTALAKYMGCDRGVLYVCVMFNLFFCVIIGAFI